MNLNEIEKFAIRLRRNLTEGVDAKLFALGFTDSIPEAPTQVHGGWIYLGNAIEDVEFGTRWERLKQFIEHEDNGRRAAVERAAYTWFNRLVAIRILAKRGLVQPQLEWADKAAHVPMIVHRMRTGGWKPNLTPGEDAALAKIRHDPTKTREQFAILVGAFCRETPILQAAFGEIDDWTMLLVPSNLLAEGGLVDCLNDASLLSDEDYHQDELIGWLYEYYVSERHDEVYDGFNRNIKAGPDEIPAATQLFTPNWIVKYLVSNALDSTNPGAASFIDVCCGSGHILLEGFRSLLAAYDELGYSKRDAIERIFANNLTGIDIDPRARQLSTFVLLLAAANEDDSFADAHVLPQIFDTALLVGTDPSMTSSDRIACALGTSKTSAVNELVTTFALLRNTGDNIGSLLKVEISPETRSLVETRINDVEDPELKRALKLVLKLTCTYSALVTNPPYLASDKLNVELKDYLEKHYKDGKSNLFSAFMLRLIEMCGKDGRVGMITMESWMFLSSFKKLRCMLIEEKTIISMAHLGPHVFAMLSGEVASTTAFVIANKKIPDYKATYYRLVEGGDSDDKGAMYEEALKRGGKNVFKIGASDFAKIPGSPIAYWVGEKMFKAFEHKTIGDNFDSSVGLQTGDNNKFIRFWFEVSFNDIFFGAKTSHDTFQTRKYFPYNKGGSFRKWFGNDDSIVDWRNDGENIKNNASRTGHHWQQYADELKFKELITWSRIAKERISFRYKPFGYMSDMAGFSLFANGKMSLLYLLGFANTHVAQSLLNCLSPTINYMLGPVNSLPISDNTRLSSDIETIAAELITLSRSDWDEYETSWDFKVNPLVREGWQKSTGGMSLETAWECVFARRMEWAARIKELEEENNRLFIEAYGVEDELKPDVAWKDVSITGNPFYRYKVDGERRVEDIAPYHGVPSELEAKARADAMRELLSYGMGILMGRYSLEQEGLILASQGETYQDYLARVHGADKIRPDDDGIIPAIALDGDFFQDNILHRMREFLSVAFGNDALPGNLNFIEAALGCKIDKYLTEKFFDDHVKMYGKRPIYWLFESPKGYFRAFAYMHRMTGATAGLIRNKYLLPYIAHLEKCHASESAKGAAMTSVERKRVKEIEKAIADCKKYDLTLHDIAEQSIAIDLDDGVVVNWAKYKSVLAKI